MEFPLFVVLIFSTSVMGVPLGVDDKGISLTKLNEMLDTFGNGTILQTEIIHKVKDHETEVSDFILEIEDRLANLTFEIGIVNTEKNTFLKQVFKKYRSIKTSLKNVRVELHELATETLFKVDDMILYMDVWEGEEGDTYSVDEKRAYLKEQIDLLKDLLVRSEKILKDAKDSYDSMYEEFSEIEQNLAEFKVDVEAKLDKVLAMDSMDMEVAGRVPAAGLTALWIVLDIFGCLGLCSAFGNTIAWTATEAILADKKSELTESVENAIKPVVEIISENKKLGILIEEETKKVVTWKTSVTHLKSFLDRTPQEHFFTLRLKRNAFQKDLLKLRDAANEFYNLPDKAFRQDILDKALKNPTKRKSEHKERRILLNTKNCIENTQQTIRECEKLASHTLISGD
jgi:hypothetical protein